MLTELQTYISAVTDPKPISVVGRASELERVQAFAAPRGLHSQRVHIRGKLHNPENTQLATDLKTLCLTHDSLRLPSTSELKVPFRSNLRGEIIKQSLIHEILHTILTSRCDCYQQLGFVAIDLNRDDRPSHNLIKFGTRDCLRLSLSTATFGRQLKPSRQLGFAVIKTDTMKLIKNSRPALPASHQARYKYPSDAVAVVGMGCRFLGANNAEELWELLSCGKSMVEKLRKDRIDTQQSFRVKRDHKCANRPTILW